MAIPDTGLAGGCNPLDDLRDSWLDNAAMLDRSAEPPVLRLLVVRLKPGTTAVNMKPGDGLLTATSALLCCCAGVDAKSSCGVSLMLGKPA